MQLLQSCQDDASIWGVRHGSLYSFDVDLSDSPTDALIFNVTLQPLMQGFAADKKLSLVVTQWWLFCLN